MARHIVILFLILILSANHAFTQGWTSYFGGSGSDEATDIIQTSDSSFLALGNTYGYGIGGKNMLVIKIDPAGNLVWQVALGGDLNETARKLTENSAGHYFIVGETNSFSTGVNQIYLVKLNNQGSIIWETTFSNSNSAISVGRITSVGTDVVILGTMNVSGNDDCFLMKVDSSGNQVWLKTIGGSEQEQAMGFTKVHDGGFMICGRYISSTTTTGFVARTDASGDTIWTKVINIGNEYYVRYQACIELKNDSTFILAGKGGSDMFGTYYISRINIDGVVLNHFTQSGYLRYVSDISPTADGGFVATGKPFMKFDYKATPIYETPNIKATSIHTNFDGSFVYISSNLNTAYPMQNQIVVSKTNSIGVSNTNLTITPSFSPLLPACTDSVTINVPAGFDNYQWYYYQSSWTTTTLPNSDTNAYKVSYSGPFFCVMHDGNNVIATPLTSATFRSPTITALNYSDTVYSCFPTSQIVLSSLQGSPSVYYQWLLNDTIIPGATTQSFIPIFSGSYYCQIYRYGCGTVNSDTVVVYLNTIPAISISATKDSIPFYPDYNVFCESLALTTIADSNFSYQWFKNGIIIPGNSHTITINDPGSYSVMVSNSCGSALSQAYDIYPDSIFLTVEITGPLMGCGTDSTTFSAPDHYPYTYNWYNSSVNLGSTNSIFPDSIGYYYSLLSRTCNSIVYQFSTDTVYYAYSMQTQQSISFPGSSLVICSNDSLQLSINGYPGANYQWYIDGSPITGADSSYFFATLTGNYYCMSFLSGCDSIQSFTLFIRNGLPEATISSEFTQVCSGLTGTIQLETNDLIGGMLTNLQWFKNGVWMQWSQGLSLSVNSIGTYHAVLTNVCGADTTNSITFTVPNSDVSIYSNISGNFFCHGDSVILTADNISGYSYQWKLSGQVIQGATDTLLVVFTPGEYTLTYFNGYCNVTTSPLQLISTGSNKPFIWNTTTTNICESGNVLLATSQDSAFNAQWFLNQVPLPGEINYYHNAVLAGIYHVQFTDSMNCIHLSDPISVSYSIPGVEIYTMNESGVICNNTPITLRVNKIASSYQWYMNNTLIPGANLDSLHTSTPGYYYVLITNSSGCDGSDGIAIIANNFNAINGSSTDDYCNKGIGVASMGSGHLKYEWSNGASSNTISNLNLGIYTVTVTYMSGCTSESTFNILNHDSLTVNISGPVIACAGTNTILNAGNNFSSYLWSTGDSTQAINVSTSGMYMVTVTNSTGCIGSASLAIIINSSPFVEISPSLPGPYCTGSTVNLTATTGYPVYSWSNGASVQSIPISSSGVFIVTVTDSLGCNGSDSVQIEFDPPNQIYINATPAPPYCAGDSILLNVQSIGTQLLWSTGDTANSVLITTPGIYEVQTYDTLGCLMAGSIPVNFMAAPVITTLPLSPVYSCLGYSVTFQADPGFANFVWSTGDTTSSITVHSSGIYHVTVTDTFGCSSTDSTILIYNVPTASITALGPTTFCQGDSVQLEVVGTGVNYLWYRNSAIVLPVNTGMFHSAKSRGKYYCVIIDSAGCTNSTDTIHVEVPCIFVQPPHERNLEREDSFLEVYPNPSDDLFNLMIYQTEVSSTHLQLTDVTGKIVPFSYQMISPSRFQIGPLPQGVFFLYVKNKGIKTKPIKLLSL